MIRSLAIAALAITLCLPAALGAAAEERMRTISVTGTGTVAATPDMALVRLGVEARARDARSALSASNAAMGSMFDTLKAAGIQPRDIQTSGLSLSPEYDHSAKAFF